MKEQQVDTELVRDRYRSIDIKSSNSRTYNAIQVILIFLILSPFIAIFSGIFLAIFLSMFNIYFSFQSYFLYFETTVGISAILIGLYYFFFLFIFIIITFVSYRRTNFRGYLYESLIELQFVLAPGIIFILYVFVIQNIFLPFVIIFLISFEYKLIKKPLIYGSTYYYRFLNQRSINSESADIVTSQSVYVNDFKDGYSSRPVIENIKDILPSEINTDLEVSLKQFANFLAINGDLIGYEIVDNKLKMFLRTRFIQKTQIFNPRTTVRKAKQLLKKENLTAIIIDFNNLEMSFKLNKYDYDYLDNLTYYQLSERILKQFKVGIKEFLNENFVDSYEEINPEHIIEKSFFLTDKSRAFLIIGYIVSMFIMGPILILVTGSNTLTQFTAHTYYFVIIFILWPLFLWVDAQTVNNQYAGNYKLLIKEQLIPLISLVLGALLSLVITIIIFVLLLKHESQKIYKKKRKLKLLH